jgi:hypothetical protein
MPEHRRTPDFITGRQPRELTLDKIEIVLDGVKVGRRWQVGGSQK